ncbi:rRNA pseudouridine synthase [Gammaproteobacteria bacterium]|jgi:23S rRNA pseudouridine2605 synthase|nr:rRNA pseudouridine synthase [Gammaproteobacteria bacterium]MDB4252939.1 rRNA pseudouridine synthase [Gammaproteobacteria bacterium]MDC1190974.1 rRNA pseudouridine synthase [Gammaproteobacteria bacterium]|tara:strand:- start:2690 stop:3415 length:726 start_codon:yes stop_codon:yes gene_type:complete
MSIRLQKFLASAGVGSRRGCEELIQKGLVKVNGKIASIGSSVSSEDEVEYQNKIIRSKEVSLKVIILNKPPGVLSSNVREKDLPRVFDYLPRSSNQRDWISIGRLDINTSGLMLFTNEGVFANYCMHPSNSIDREYLVRAKGSFNSDKEAQMRKGIEIDGSIHKFSDLVEGEKTGANQWFSACLTSGKNKEVRKLFEAVGMTVSRLKRTRYGPIFLPSTLAEGKCKELTENEILSLKNYGQ